MLKKVLLIASFTFVLAFNSFGASQVTLKDTSKHWAKDYINDMVSKKYIKGYPDNTFKPNNKISRIEFISILSRSINSNPKIMINDTSKAFVYHDMNSTYSWALNDYKKLMYDFYIYNNYNESTYGLTTSLNTFGDLLKPSQPITREECVALLYNFIDGYKVFLRDSNNLKDINSNPYRTQILSMQYLNIISGYPDGTFKPKNQITRAEASKILSVFLSKKNSMKNRVWTDTPQNNIYNKVLEPQDVVKTVIALEQSGDFHKAYEYFSNDSKKSFNFDSYKAYMKTPETHCMFGFEIYISDKLQYKVEKLSGNQVKVYYKRSDNSSGNYIGAKTLNLVNGKWYLDFDRINTNDIKW